MVEYTADRLDQPDQIIELFRDTFAASEGAEEGAVIGGLVRDLLDTTNRDALFAYSAREAGALAGCIIFTRLHFAEDTRVVYLLSPVAVQTGVQGQGVGQRLLRFGLDDLRAKGADVAVTYGDPNYYSKVGFQQVTEHEVPAPQPLNHPHGWLAQSLDGSPLAPLQGASRCVGALNKPEYW